MKKLLIIQESLNGGGAEKVLCNILKSLNRNKYKITLVVLYGRGIYLNSLPDDIEVKVIIDNRLSLVNKLLYRYDPLRYSLLEYKVRKALKNSHFDTAVSFLEGISAVLHSRILDYADTNIGWVHTDMLRNHWCTRYCTLKQEQKAYLSFDKVAFVSRECMVSLNKLFKVSGEQIVMMNPVDTGVILKQSEECHVPANRFTIVNVGRYVNEKRHDRLIDAAKILSDKGLDFELWILGAGCLEKEIESKIAGLDLNDKIKLIGFKPNPYPYIKSADVFCLSSDTEGYPTVVSEALILGVPVVTTPVSGVSDQLKEGGGVIADFTAESLAKELERLMTDSKAYEALKAQVPEAARKFDFDVQMQNFEAIL
ncbi:MAG: glycosyltransferase [Muribaculaceae bacterium]